MTATNFAGSLTGNASTATSATSSTTATTATNLANGSGGTIPYQSAAGTTAMLANGTSGYFLEAQGTTVAPVWAALPAANLTVTSQTTTYNIATTDNVVLCSGSAFTATLPTAVGVTGKIYQIEKTDVTFANVITIATTSSQTIGNPTQTSYKLTSQGEILYIVSDGSNWQILSHTYPTAWITYAVTTSAAFGTISASSFWARREGDSIHVRGSFTVGTTAASTMFISLPSGHTIATAKLPSTASQAVGLATDLPGAGPTQVFSTNTGYDMFYDGSTNNEIFITSEAGSNVFTKVNGNAQVTSGDSVSFDFIVPLTGWNG
jgi:hypothetical protein